MDPFHIPMDVLQHVVFGPNTYVSDGCLMMKYRKFYIKNNIMYFDTNRSIQSMILKMISRGYNCTFDGFDFYISFGNKIIKNTFQEFFSNCEEYLKYCFDMKNSHIYMIYYLTDLFGGLYEGSKILEIQRCIHEILPLPIYEDVWYFYSSSVPRKYELNQQRGWIKSDNFI